jgi:hypothetical protein
MWLVIGIVFLVAGCLICGFGVGALYESRRDKEKSAKELLPRYLSSSEISSIVTNLIRDTQKGIIVWSFSNNSQIYRTTYRTFDMDYMISLRAGVENRLNYICIYDQEKNPLVQTWFPAVDNLLSCIRRCRPLNA